MCTDYEDVHMFSMQQRKYNKFGARKIATWKIATRMIPTG